MNRHTGARLLPPTGSESAVGLILDWMRSFQNKQGSTDMTTIVTDDSSLRNLPDIQLDKITNNLVLSFLEDLLSLTFEVAVTPGKQNGVADFFF